MKRIQLNLGEHLALENNILRYQGLPKYAVKYYAVPSENIGVQLQWSKGGRQL